MSEQQLVERPELPCGDPIKGRPDSQRPIGERFTFNGRIILHDGIYLERDVASRLLPRFEDATDWKNIGLGEEAAELARQLRSAIEQHDKYWNAQLEPAQ